MSLTLINRVLRGREHAKTDEPLELVPIDDIADAAVGSRIRALRVLSNLSQTALAEKSTLHLPGDFRVTQSDISRIEKNPGRSKFFILSAICKALDITIADLTETELEIISYDNTDKEIIPTS